MIVEGFLSVPRRSQASNTSCRLLRAGSLVRVIVRHGGATTRTPNVSTSRLHAHTMTVNAVRRFWTTGLPWTALTPLPAQHTASNRHD